MDILFSRLLKKSFEWFDRLTTNGLKAMNSMFPPFALSLSKGEWRVFQQPVRTLLLLLMLSATDVAAQSIVRYELPDGSMVVGVQTLKGALPDGALTILGLSLDKSTFQDVRRVIGDAPLLLHTGDPHEADSICYSAVNVSNSSSIQLSFAAGWPENPTESLTSFTLSDGKLLPVKGRCTTSPKLTKKISTINGLGLGLTQAELIKILGTPSLVSSAWIVYSFETYREYSKTEQDKFPRAPGGGTYKGEYIYHNLVAHFTQSKLDLLQVSVGGETDW